MYMYSIWSVGILALVAVVSAQRNVYMPYNDVKVCDLVDVETLSWSRCDVQDRLTELEAYVQELHKFMEQSPVATHVPVFKTKAKRKNEFIRFGKRSDASRLQDKREEALETLAMAKRKNEFIRFG